MDYPDDFEWQFIYLGRYFMKRKVIYVTIGLLIIASAYMTSELITLKRYNKAINEITIENVDLSKIEDGIGILNAQIKGIFICTNY